MNINLINISVKKFDIVLIFPTAFLIKSNLLNINSYQIHSYMIKIAHSKL